MPENPVRRTLRRDLLPYLVSARRLRSQWFCRLHVVFGYTTDVVFILAAMGISPPILALLGKLSNTSKPPTDLPSLSTALGPSPEWLYVPAAAVLLLWIFLRVAFNREDGQKRAVLAKSCFQLLRQAEAGLPAILSKPDPMPDITNLLEKTIRQSVDRNIQEQAWPWTPFAPGIDDDVTKQLEDLCKRFETDWTCVDISTLQQRV